MTSRTQIRFVGPEGMAIGWQIPNGYAEHQIFAPGVYDFAQGSMYRLKLTDIPGREGVVVYPTLQVYPSHPQTDAYLSHNSVPLQITDEDLDQIESGNFVTKVIYLPSPKHQELAIAGVGTLVSTPLADWELDPELPLDPLLSDLLAPSLSRPEQLAATRAMANTSAAARRDRLLFIMSKCS